MFFLESDLECFDISLRKISKSSSWAFGSCSSSLEYSSSGIYIEKCCISPGDHILTCNNHEGTDWSRNVLTIKGHQLCNDYVGYTAMIRLNIEGTVKSRYTYRHNKSNNWHLITIYILKLCENNYTSYILRVNIIQGHSYWNRCR